MNYFYIKSSLTLKICFIIPLQALESVWSVRADSRFVPDRIRRWLGRGYWEGLASQGELKGAHASPALDYVECHKPAALTEGK
jgi:hypothetical protein